MWLPAHRSRAMRAWLATQRSRLVVERLSAYAPELNPVEGMWSSLKAVELANLTSPTLAEVIAQAHKGIQRMRRTPHLAYSFAPHRPVGLLSSSSVDRGRQGPFPCCRGCSQIKGVADHRRVRRERGA